MVLPQEQLKKIQLRSLPLGEQDADTMYEMVYALKRYTFLQKLRSRRYKAMLPKHM